MLLGLWQVHLFICSRSPDRDSVVAHRSMVRLQVVAKLNMKSFQASRFMIIWLVVDVQPQPMCRASSWLRRRFAPQSIVRSQSLSHFLVLTVMSDHEGQEETLGSDGSCDFCQQKFGDPERDAWLEDTRQLAKQQLQPHSLAV